MYIVNNVTKIISEQGFLCKYNFIVPRCLCRNIIVDLQKFIFNLFCLFVLRGSKLLCRPSPGWPLNSSSSCLSLYCWCYWHVPHNTYHMFNFLRSWDKLVQVSILYSQPCHVRTSFPHSHQLSEELGFWLLRLLVCIRPSSSKPTSASWAARATGVSRCTCVSCVWVSCMSVYAYSFRCAYEDLRLQVFLSCGLCLLRLGL